MRVGVMHHLGWAVVVTADDDHEVVDRRRIDLVDAAHPAAPVHHEGGQHAMHRRGGPLDDRDLGALVAQVRASAERNTAVELDRLADDLPGPVSSLSLRRWPADFPTDIAVQRTIPYEASADSVMYRQVLAEAATERGWAVHLFDGKQVESLAAAVLGDRADQVLRGPRQRLGSPWDKDHRCALAATVLAARDGT